MREKAKISINVDQSYLARGVGHQNQIFLKANYNINIRAELNINEMTIIKALSFFIKRDFNENTILM